MPSVVVGFASGGTLILSGNPWSGIGKAGVLTGGVQLRMERFPVSASGSIFIALSGGMNINSGQYTASGGPYSGGMLDGMQLTPGDTYFVPKLAFGQSGVFCNLYAMPDNLGSGARLYFEFF